MNEIETIQFWENQEISKNLAIANKYLFNSLVEAACNGMFEKNLLTPPSDIEKASFEFLEKKKVKGAFFDFS